MKRLLLALALLAAMPCRAAISIDATACAGGVASACPQGQTLNTAGGAVTTTTGSFSTSKAGLLLIMVGTTGGGFSGSVTSSGGSFSQPITQLTTVQHGGQSYAGLFTAFSSAALSGVTFSAVNSNSSVNHTAIVVIPFSSPVVLGQQINNNGIGTAETLTSTNILNASLVFAAFSDKNSSTARTPGAGTSTVFDSQDATTSTDVWFAVSTTTSTGGTVTLSASAPAVVNNGWSSFNIEAMDATVSTAHDPLACPLNSSSAASPLTNCPQATGTTATSLTTTSFSTIAAIELICVVTQQYGVGTTAVAITDSGITKSTTWTKIGSSAGSTTQEGETWCAVTSAAVSSQTVTATFTATSLILTDLIVAPYLYANTSALPTNYVPANNTSGAATAIITPIASGSMAIGSFAYLSGTGPTVTTTPQAYAVAISSDYVSHTMLGEYAWANGTSAETIGVSAPTSLLWSGQLTEIQVAVQAPSGPVNSGMMGFWGALESVIDMSRPFG